MPPRRWDWKPWKSCRSWTRRRIQPAIRWSCSFASMLRDWHWFRSPSWPTGHRWERQTRLMSSCPSCSRPSLLPWSPYWRSVSSNGSISCNGTCCFSSAGWSRSSVVWPCFSGWWASNRSPSTPPCLPTFCFSLLYVDSLSAVSAKKSTYTTPLSKARKRVSRLPWRSSPTSSPYWLPLPFSGLRERWISWLTASAWESRQQGWTRSSWKVCLPCWWNRSAAAGRGVWCWMRWTPTARIRSSAASVPSCRDRATRLSTSSPFISAVSESATPTIRSPVRYWPI